jgi:hypothetical protein
MTTDARVLHLSSSDELLAFHAEFGLDNWKVSWIAVAEQWQGIIIAPYLWERRLGDPSWYYTWDCASGCIWDATAIASVSLTEPAT